MEELQKKHKQEKKELQANIQKMKQLVPKNDKKRRKEMNQEIEEMEAKLKKVQDADLWLFNQRMNPESAGDKAADLPVVEKLEQLKIDLEANQMRFEASSQASDKMTKAEKRRAKKEREQQERERRILEGEKDNENHVRIVEINKLDKLLKENHLKLHDIASDGDCMYKAIEHQLGLQGVKKYTVNDLRKLVSDALRKNKDDYLPFLTSSSNEDGPMGDEEFEKYCADVEDTKKWGGDLELQIISKAISADIHVYQADGPIIKFECGKSALGRPLLISFHKYLYQLGAHYNSLLKTN